MSGRIDVHLSFDSPLQVSIVPPRADGQAVTAITTIGGSLMPAAISIDDKTGQTSVHWVDDKGDTDAAAPAGAQVAYASDNPAVASVDAATGLISPLAEGSANVIVTITDAATGGPLLEPDGVTAFSAPPAPFTVVAGAAVGASLEIKA